MADHYADGRSSAPVPGYRGASPLPASPFGTPGAFAMGGDVVQGMAFNRTRLIIKQESLMPPRSTGAGTPTSFIANSTWQPTPSADRASAHTPPPARPQGDDYLASLLPTSGFDMPAPKFGRAPAAPSATHAAHDMPPDFPLQPLGMPAGGSALDPHPHHPHPQQQRPEALSAAAALALVAGEEEDASAVEPRGNSADLGSSSCVQEDDSAHKNGLTATYQFHPVTADGGVELAFDNLENNMDTAAVAKLHHAIETLVSEQHQHPAVDKQLEEAVAQELKVLNANIEELNSVQEREKQLIQQVVLEGGDPDAAQADEGGPAADAAVAASAFTFTPNATPPRTSATAGLNSSFKDTKNASLRDTLRGKLPPLRAPTPPGDGRPSARTSQSADPAPLPPVALAAQQQQQQAGEGPARLASHLSNDLGRAASRLLRSVQSQREQLTSTIKLGFQSGRFKRLNIAILVVGTRGDVQPFVGIGLKLKTFGHRVRIASHAVYREFVTGFGLEFYPLGGDPKVLSEFVVKHRGIMPGWDIKDALQQREQVRQILYSTWGACTEPDPERPDKPFRADAIVANPPSYGHTHCAEALNVPLHVVFTMPWTPTKVFPQPFARIKTNMTGPNSMAREVMNWMSYFAMEDLAWLGMSGMQKDFRQRVCGLKTWDKYHTSHAIYYSQVPITYIWSSHLVPRPIDWPAHCEVVGFCNVELRKLTSYEPPAELKSFLDSGPPPVYIGFGSLVVDDPILLTQQFLQAIERTGLRAIIQRGWGGLGGKYGKQPDGSEGKVAPANVLFIDSAPHDWLFQCVCAVVHHGGAGTTATGLLAGKPTFIVPFFGDQPFWGAACERAGVGPAPVAIDYLTTEKIVDALKELILPTRLKAAQKLAAEMAKEDGIAAAVDHIHRTIYTTLLGRSMPIWMKPKPAAPAVATTSIQQAEGGAEGLRGMMALPTRIFGRGKSGVAQRGLAGELGPNGAAGNGSDLASGFRNLPPAVEVVGGVRRKGGFWSFLGC